MKKDVAEENAKTYIPAYSIYHSDKNNGEKSHAPKYDRVEGNIGSEPRVDTIVNTKVNADDTLVDTSNYDRPVNTAKSDLEAYDKGTTDDPVAAIIMTTDDGEKESEILNCGSH